ncbi:MAG: metal-sensing transcriptional repressor [Dehalococcoidia bacterium]
MTPPAPTSLLSAYIEGHLPGCAAWWRACTASTSSLVMYAVRRAIEKTESKMLRGHVHHCVVDGIQRGDDGVLDELVELYEIANR